MPLISVIVPVYNVEQYAHRCINSILNQTFTDFELILVDDGSTDKSGNICDEYGVEDSRVRVFHQNNKGQSAARNLALKWVFDNADSSYIAFIDSDDWIHPRYLELLHNAVVELNVNISQCIHIETQKDDVAVELNFQKKIVTVEEQYTHYYSACVWGKLFARKCFENIWFPEGKIYEDVAIWYKILFTEKKIAIVEDELYYYYINPESSIRQDWLPRRLVQIDVWKEQIAFLKKNTTDVVLFSGISRFLWILKSQIEDIKRSSKVNALEKIYYRNKLINDMRAVLQENKKNPERIQMYDFYMQKAYPLRMWCYWTYKGIINNEVVN